MTWWQALFLGTLQGVTEFLPISSSGHLVLAQEWLGVLKTDQPRGAALFFDGVLHLGTLVAVLLWFRQTILTSSSTTTAIWPRTRRDALRLGLLLAVASAPAALAVLFAGQHIRDSFEKPIMVAWSFLALGGILLFTDRMRPGTTEGSKMSWWQALVIGCCQGVSAVIRGMSRSGMTVAGGVAVGLERGWAVRFSFLMSVVASLGLGGFGIVQALMEPEAREWLTFELVLMALLGAATSGVVGYLTIDPLIRMVRRARLWCFTIYLWVVAIAVLISHAL
jgi:undecaprenyl-diphosphatase